MWPAALPAQAGAAPGPVGAVVLSRDGAFWERDVKIKAFVPPIIENGLIAAARRVVPNASDSWLRPLATIVGKCGQRVQVPPSPNGLFPRPSFPPYAHQLKRGRTADAVIAAFKTPDGEVRFVAGSTSGGERGDLPPAARRSGFYFQIGMLDASIDRTPFARWASPDIPPGPSRLSMTANAPVRVALTIKNILPAGRSVAAHDARVLFATIMPMICHQLDALMADPSGRVFVTAQEPPRAPGPGDDNPFTLFRLLKYLHSNKNALVSGTLDAARDFAGRWMVEAAEMDRAHPLADAVRDLAARLADLYYAGFSVPPAGYCLGDVDTLQVWSAAVAAAAAAAADD